MIITIMMITRPLLALPPRSVNSFEMNTVSCHNFKSRNFKLSVSNPKNKYVVDSSILSQISNCQSLGRKNKLEISKTDRNEASPRPSPAKCKFF